MKYLIDMAKRLEGLAAAQFYACCRRCDQSEGQWMNMFRFRVRSDGTITTQFTMTTLEELGLLKMDFLGLTYA